MVLTTIVTGAFNQLITGGPHIVAGLWTNQHGGTWWDLMGVYGNLIEIFMGSND